VVADTPTAFVSYSRVDSEFAMQLAEHLKAAGANVWLDQLDIEPGTPWDSAIEEALLKSTHMLVVLSTVSVTSDNVRDEVSYALSQQMKVIPVLYRECKVPFRLARLQHIDFRNDYDIAFKALLKTLRVEQQSMLPSIAPVSSLEDNASPAEAAETQRRNEEDRLQAQRAEHLAQQAQWEEEQRLRDQVEAARQAEAARQVVIARQAESARQVAEAERQRAAAAWAEQTRRQEQEAIESARRNAPSPTPVSTAPATPTPSVWNSPQPQPQRKVSTPYHLGRIGFFAVVAGLLRAICSFASAFLVRLFGYRLSNLVSAILIGAITGLVLYRVLLLFKPELSKKQVRPIFWVWVAAGIALAAINVGIESLSSFGILVFVPPTLVAGAITGDILARALQNSRSKGIIIGIVSFAIPAFSIQILSRVLIPGLPISYEEFDIVTLILSFCVAAIEVGLLLWFIRNWGRSRPTQAS
jgi:TIR domain